jgi:mRNA interferase RelE/StbE
MAGLRPVIPPEVAEVIRHLPPEIKRAVKAAIRAIAANPGGGEPLQRELKGLWKFRVQRFRIVYRIRKNAVRISAVGERRSVYQELAERLRQRRK